MNTAIEPVLMAGRAFKERIGIEDGAWPHADSCAALFVLALEYDSTNIIERDYIAMFDGHVVTCEVVQ